MFAAAQAAMDTESVSGDYEEYSEDEEYSDDEEDSEDEEYSPVARRPRKAQEGKKRKPTESDQVSVQLAHGRQGGSGKARRQQDILATYGIEFEQGMTQLEGDVKVLVDVSSVVHTVVEAAARVSDVPEEKVRELVTRCVEAEKAATELRVDLRNANVRYVLVCDLKPEFLDEQAQSVGFGTHLRRMENTLAHVATMSKTLRKLKREKADLKTLAQGHTLSLTGQAQVAVYHAVKHLCSQHDVYECGNDKVNENPGACLADDVKNELVRLYNHDQHVTFVITLHDSDWGYNVAEHPVVLLHPRLGFAIVEPHVGRLMSLVAALLLSSDIEAAVRAPRRNMLRLDAGSLNELLAGGGSLLTYIYQPILWDDKSVAHLLQGTRGTQPASKHLDLVQEHAQKYLAAVKVHLCQMGFDDRTINTLTSLHAWDAVFDTGGTKAELDWSGLPGPQVLGQVDLGGGRHIGSLFAAYANDYAVTDHDTLRKARLLPPGEVVEQARQLEGEQTLRGALDGLKEQIRTRWEAMKRHDASHVPLENIGSRYAYPVTVDVAAEGVEGLVAAARGTDEIEYTNPASMYNNMISVKKWEALCKKHADNGKRERLSKMRGVLEEAVRDKLNTKMTKAMKKAGVDASMDVFVGDNQQLAAILGPTPPSSGEAVFWDTMASNAIDYVYQKQDDDDDGHGASRLDAVINTILPDPEDNEWEVFMGFSTPKLDSDHTERLASSSCVVELGSLEKLRNAALINARSVEELDAMAHAFGLIVAIQCDLLECGLLEPSKDLENVLSACLQLNVGRFYLKPPSAVEITCEATPKLHNFPKYISVTADLVLSRQPSGGVVAEYLDELAPEEARCGIDLRCLPSGAFTALCQRGAALVLTNWKVMLINQAVDNLVDLVVASNGDVERRDVLAVVKRLHKGVDDEEDTDAQDTPTSKACEHAVATVLREVVGLSVDKYKALMCNDPSDSGADSHVCAYELARECQSTRKLYPVKQSLHHQLAVEREKLFGRWALSALCDGLLDVCWEGKEDTMLAWSILCGAVASSPGACSSEGEYFPPPCLQCVAGGPCDCAVGSWLRGAKLARNGQHVHALRASFAWHMVKIGEENGSSRLFSRDAIKAMQVCASRCANGTARVVTHNEDHNIIPGEDMGTYTDPLLLAAFNVFAVVDPMHAPRISKTPFINDGHLSIRLFSAVHALHVRHWQVPAGPGQRRLYYLEHLILPDERLSLFPTLRACLNLLRNPTATSLSDTKPVDDAQLLRFLKGNVGFLEDAPLAERAQSSPFLSHSKPRYNFAIHGKGALEGTSTRCRDKDAHTEDQGNQRRLIERVAAVTILLCQVAMYVAAHQHRERGKEVEDPHEADGDGATPTQTEAVHKLLRKWLPQSADKIIALKLCPESMEHSRRPHGVVSSFSRLIPLSSKANARLQFLAMDPGISNAPSALYIPRTELVENHNVLHFADAWRFSPPSLGAMERRTGIKRDNALLSATVREKMQELRSKRSGLFVDVHTAARAGRVVKSQCSGKILESEQGSSAQFNEGCSQRGDSKTHDRREQKRRIRKMREQWLAQVRATEKMQLELEEGQVRGITLMEEGQLRRITLLCIGDGFKGGRGGVKKLEELAKHNMIVVRVNECNTTLRCPTCGSVHKSKHGSDRTARVKYCERCEMHRNRDFASAQAIANKVFAALRGHTIWCMTKVWQRSQIGRTFRSKIGLPENVDGEAQNLEANSSAG